MRALQSMAPFAETLVEPLAMLTSPLTPRSFHAGRRACQALASIPATRAWATMRFARAVLAAQWRSALLLEHVRRLPGEELGAFLDSRIRFPGERRFLSALATGRPLILATPHTVASVLGCVAIARKLRGSRRFAVLYQSEERNAGLPALFQRAGVAVVLLSGVGGVVRALEVLKHGGCLATMPDVFDDVSDTIVVPFFGRWLRIAGGTAFLAKRSAALLVPGYVTTRRGLVVRLEAAAPIDAGAEASGDERQDLFALTCRMFAEFERRIARAPEHWLYWDRLPRLSTPMELPRDAGSPDFEAAIANRCRALPGLLRRVPELGSLREGAST